MDCKKKKKNLTVLNDVSQATDLAPAVVKKPVLCMTM